MRTIKIASSLDGYALPVLSQKLGVDLAELEKKVREAKKKGVIPADDKASILHSIELAKVGARSLGLEEVLKILRSWEKDIEKVKGGIPVTFKHYINLLKDRRRARSLFTKKLRKRFGSNSVAVFPYDRGKDVPGNYEEVEEFKGYVLGRISEDRYILVGPDVQLVKKKPYYFGEKLLGEWIIERRRSKENS